MTRGVTILMGSVKDAAKMQPAADLLDSFGVPHEVVVASAHRTPERVADIASSARQSGIGVIICGAGKAAHLAGAVAAQTTLPVIGVPLTASALDGMDALLSTVQMPTGIPVATVAIDGAANAALLAVQILAIEDEDLAARLGAHREEMRK